MFIVTNALTAVCITGDKGVAQEIRTAFQSDRKNRNTQGERSGGWAFKADTYSGKGCSAKYETVLAVQCPVKRKIRKNEYPTAKSGGTGRKTELERNAPALLKNNVMKKTYKGTDATL